MPSLQRAQLLRDRHRTAEAIAEIKLVLAEDPNNAEAHCMLAFTYLGAEGQKREALKSIDSAIAIEADNPDYLSTKSIILSSLDRGKEALAIAQVAIGYSPGPFQWYAKALAHTELRQWTDAESSCHQALEIDADFDDALNLKNNLLRIQGKLDQADQASAEQLSRNAENPDALANAGWAQLHRGDHKKAEEFFREALRSEPENEYARGGLLEAYKARSLFYRVYLKWVFLLSKMEGKGQWIIIIGIYLGFRFGRAILSQFHPALGVGFVIIYLLFVFGTFIAGGIGNFLLLKDPLLRLVLTRREKWDGLIVGTLFFGGIILCLTGAFTGWAGFLEMGICFVAGCIPSAMIFPNYSRNGQFLFGGITIFAIISGIVNLVIIQQTGNPDAYPAGPMFFLTITAAALTTWISGIPSLRRNYPID